MKTTLVRIGLPLFFGIAHTLKIKSYLQLHRFTWLQDDLIGKLPIEWNWLPDEFGSNLEAKLLHYTLGTPCFKDYANTPMASEWHKEQTLINYCEE